MNRSVLSSLLAGVWLAACTPSPAPVSYFEPMDAQGNSNSWLLPLTPGADQGRANQAAGAERLDGLSGTTDRVRYRMLDRYSAFMLSGDLATGTPAAGEDFETLQLPACASDPTGASGDRLERTVGVMAFDSSKWTSFRVYNRGACSSTTSWPSLAQSFGDGIADQLNAKPDITNASLSGSLGVVLRSEFHDPIGAPDDRDELHFHGHMTADSITSCQNVGLDIDFVVSLEHTDAMQLQVQDQAFAVGCRLGAELESYNRQASSHCRLPALNDPSWLDLQASEAALRVMNNCAFYDADAETLRSQVDLQTASIGSALAHGREVICDPGARLFFSFDSSDWTVRRHRELSGRGASHDTDLLLGVSNMDGHDLAAHDTLARVLSISASNFSASGRRPRNGRCRNPRRRGIMDNIEAAFRDSLPLAINAAVLGRAVRSPTDFAIESNDWVECNTDAECDFRAPGHHAAYEIPRPGYAAIWRGARAVCRHHPFHGPCSTDRVCWPLLEPDRLNVRPEGLEVVVEDDIDLDVDPQDPQVSFFSDTVRGQVCDVGRSGFLAPTEPLDDQPRGRMTFDFSATSGSGGPQCPPSPVEMIP